MLVRQVFQTRNDRNGNSRALCVVVDCQPRGCDEVMVLVGTRGSISNKMDSLAVKTVVAPMVEVDVREFKRILTKAKDRNIVEEV